MNKELNLSRAESSFIIAILKKHSELMTLKTKYKFYFENIRNL